MDELGIFCAKLTLMAGSQGVIELLCLAAEKNQNHVPICRGSRYLVYSAVALAFYLAVVYEAIAKL